MSSNADIVIAIATVVLAVVTSALFAVTSIYSVIAWKQYRAGRDPRIVIYPEINGKVVTLVVANLGNGNAYGVRIWPDDAPFNFYKTRLMQADGIKIPVLGPSQKLSHIWFYWEQLDKWGGAATLTCTYDSKADGGRDFSDRFFIDPSWMNSASVGLSMGTETQLVHHVAALNDKLSSYLKVKSNAGNA